MVRYFVLSILVSAMVFLTGCETGDSFAKADFDFSGLQTIAIIDVVGPVGSEGAKNQIADFVAMELLRKGYSPVERSQVQTLLKEQEFQASDMTPEQGAVQAGKILNVPTVMIVNIPEFKEDMSMTMKMINVEDGTVLWLGTGSGTTGKTLATILGAAGGAGAGVVVAGDDSTDKTVGGVVGGVIGGAAANLLSPQKAQTAQKMITKICKKMPSRIPAPPKKKLFNW